MDSFLSICRSRNLSVPELPQNGNIIKYLAELVLNYRDYTIPVFASFENLALPIVSEWILGNACSQQFSTVFCRLSSITPLLPCLQPLMEHLLVMQMGAKTPLAAMDDLDVLSGILRLLLHDYGRFSRYFNAEDLRSVASESQAIEIRTAALAALAVLMEVSEYGFDKWTAEYCGSDVASTTFEFQHVLADSRTRAEDALLIESMRRTEIQDIHNDDLKFENSLVTNIAGVFVPRLGGAGNLVSDKKFISTDTSCANLRKVVKSLLLDRPLLLIGEHGSGKTTVIEYLHERIRGGELVRIHLGDQTDAKSLVGTYTTGQKPGTFEWIPGALTSAVRNGSWVLIEDIDKAPNEIVSVLLSLLTSRELVIPSRNQTIKAAPGFQIVATTSALPITDGEVSVEIVGARSWVPVVIDPPTNGDLETLVHSIKPFLAPLAVSMLVTTFRRVEEWQEHHRLGRLARTGDLVKLVNRIGKQYTTDDIYREAVSCFTSFLSDPLPLAHVIGDCMAIAASQIEPLLSRHQPAISISDQRLIIGRAEIERRNVTGSAARNMDLDTQSSKFALTQPTLKLLEEIGISVQHSEPVLLVGETGTGKTAVVQHLAKLSRRKLVVINVSQQVEAGDLVGGFKPVDARQLSGALLEEFGELFDATFNRAKNHQFLEVLNRMVSKQQWTNVIKLLREAVKMASSRSKPSDDVSARQGNTKKARTQDPSSTTDWTQFALQIDAFEQRLQSVQQAAQFQFIEGLLVRAIRQGSWVLLDELNLAPPDTIESIGELLSSKQLTLLESGGQVVHAHSAFRLFANMNPATDVGKRDLPIAVRSLFTEIWSPSPDRDQEALRAIVTRYLPPGTEPGIINDVAILYTEARNLSNGHELVDGAGQRPHFSIRTLSRALSTAASISKLYGLRRALYEAFCMCFMTLLDEASAAKLNEVADEKLLSKLPNRRSILSQIPPKPAAGNYVQFSHWWMPCGNGASEDVSDYILTPSVERNLLNLVRAASTRMFPILIQGPTSSGKTSMISYLARRTGHTVIRINNHDHTDLAEYLGGYESDSDGRLVFREGALVKALREGHWLVLDELNLAPTDVLEALNRLLDDNRELLVPETQEIIKPHPDFILFATQNPPGLYAGRKVLSRAFRNRFLELHFGDIPEQELEIILRDRSGIAPTYAAKIVEVYRELARQRIQRVFEQAATLRDLFRWARRPAIGYEQLAFNGYALLGERSRSKEDRDAIKKIIERVMRVEVDTNIGKLASEDIMAASPPEIVWTGAMRRVLALVEMALSQNEPVLLVGETGCGKTTIVQAIAAARGQNLITVNAHQNTETGDLVGSQRPVRSSESLKLFEWVDGPLVIALRNGCMFLLDEISLADDSVLERLNSVLETERTLFVPEIGEVEAAEKFQFLSTMNPGGDYGKKELSPALRNRFTEIWCPTVDDVDDLRMIVNARLQLEEGTYSIEMATAAIVEFSQWFSHEFRLVSLRDILSWIDFVNASGVSAKSLVHGACMVFVDGLGIHSQLIQGPETVERSRQKCIAKLNKLIGSEFSAVDSAEVVQEKNGDLMIGGFKLPLRDSVRHTLPQDFSLAAPTTALNAMRVVRAMQVNKPILLEGSPGAGKTSLISALASICGEKLTRINLSDQTDLSDLFGQDIPLAEPGKFGWRSAPFLRAMQKGEWVLLDEMNLAPQPVLEGLNACLDHRGQAYIPELDRTFTKHPGFTVFAAQNPQGQGGGRKGLPKSFVNRFSLVYVDQLGLRDLHAIAATTHPTVPASVREKLAIFMEELTNWSLKRPIVGGPFEFNLRDTLRWLDLVASDSTDMTKPQKYFNLVILQRFRTPSEREIVSNMFHKVFPPLEEEMVNPVWIEKDGVRVKHANTSRISFKWQVHHHLSILPDHLDILETGITCVSRGWPMILVGPSGSGKTSTVRLLAQLCGARLREFAMTPDVDSTDLLGEFDQLEQMAELERLWGTIEDQLKGDTSVQSAVLVDAIRHRDLESVEKLIPRTSSSIHDAISQFKSQDFSRPIFHWVDGMLVKAIENGDWIVLENANLCSAAVLDRLNSLLERGGTLLINECSGEDGSPREIIPHPNFRLFLTVNPRFGELSRAMRNRGVEIWMAADFSEFDELSQQKHTVSGALPLEFAKPLTVAHITDLKSKSWLRSVIFDEQRTPISYLYEVDQQLTSFCEAYLRNISVRSVSEIYELWHLYILEKRLKEALKLRSAKTLFELSALKRVRDSVECEFDVYGVISAATPLIVGGDKLSSVLLDLIDVEDPSRIPVFRDWLLKYAEERELDSFARSIQNALGKQYDFSKGGAGMVRIWRRYGRPLGYSTEAMHDENQKASHLAEKFDSMVKNIDPSFANQVAELKAMLSTVERVDETLLNAINHFQEAFMAAKSPALPVLGRPLRLLELPFKNFWESLALVYSAHPEIRDDESVKATLAKLSVFGNISTSALGLLSSSSRMGFIIPEIMIPPMLESTVINILQMSSQGLGDKEVNEFAQVLSEQSKNVSESMKPHELVGTIVKHFAQQLADVIPEVTDSTDFTFLQSEGEIHDSATAAVKLAQILLSLYVCPLPLDPAIAQHVWYERYLRLKEEFVDDEECWNELKNVFSSQSKDIELFLQDRELHEEPVPAIWRPQKSEIGIVHRDMVASSQLALGALSSMKSKEEIEVALKNANHLSARLARATGYRDLVTAVRAALSLLKLGMSLKQHDLECSSLNEGLPKSNFNLWFLDPTIVGYSTPVSTDYPLLVLRSMECCQSPPIDELQELLMDIYRRWTLERLKVEERQREQNAGFKYNDDENEEEVAEREFKKMFPDYDEVPDIPKREDSFVPDLVTHYCQLLTQKSSYRQNSIVDALLYAVNQLTHADGVSSAVHLPALYLSLTRRRWNNQSFENTFNFYSDPAAEEARESTRFAEAVLRFATALLEKWPEHDTLQTLVRVSEDMIALPPQTPIALYLAKLEQLHHFLYEWDRFAAKEFKASTLMADASTLIVRLRRMELSTWPALFAVEKKRSSDAAAPFWFHLFETLIVSTSDDLTSVAKVLVVFMAESPIGQFQRRLTLLESFKNHLGLLGNEPMRGCVHNVLHYYAQYVPQINQGIEDVEKRLRKQVDEVVKLASWRDVNIHALKQSAQRSHRQLFKVVKKYRALLDTKANTESNIPNISSLCAAEPFIPPSSLLNGEIGSEKLGSLISSSLFAQRPKHMKDLQSTSNMMKTYVSSVSNEAVKISAESDLLSLATDVEKRAAQLRDETPKTWCKETKKTISALRVEKQKLLTETLREMRRAGLRPTVNKNTVANQVELTSVLATAPTINASSDGVFYKMIEIMPRLRSAISEAYSSEYDHDVPQSDLQRGLAFVENAFSHILRLRRIAEKHRRGTTSLDQQQEISSLTQIAETPVIAEYDLSTAKLAISRSSHLVQNVSEVVSATLDDAPNGSDKIKSDTSRLRVLAAEISHTPELKLRTSASRLWFDNITEVLQVLLESSRHETCGGLITPLILKLSRMIDEMQNGLNPIAEPGSSEATETSVMHVCQPILVIIQQIVKLISNETVDSKTDDDSSEDDQWLTAAFSISEKLLLTLRSTEIWNRFKVASEAIYSLSIANHKLAGAYAANLLIFINGYTSLTESIERLFSCVLTSTTSGTLKMSCLLFNLATNGFCSPQPSDDGDEDEKEVGDGVGLGDGQGGQSSSKDIDENDDDVTEAMQTSNPDQEERDEDEDDKDNAKEMEGEMAGETEDMPAQSDEDNDDENDVEEDQLDEEIGDLDDLDPNAVDEKMWDDKKEELNQKEKETNESVDGEKDENAEAGSENENPQDSQVKDKDGDEGKEDDDQENNGEDEASASDAETHEDNIDQGQADELEPDVEQKDALELPDDMQLDGKDDENADDNNGNDEDDAMDVDDEKDAEDDEDAGEDAEATSPVDDNMSDHLDDDMSDDNVESTEETGETTEKVEDEENEDQEKEASDQSDDERFGEADGMSDNVSENEDTNDDDVASPNAEEAGDGKGADIEGIQGPVDDNEPMDHDQTTTTNDKTGSSGQGAADDAQTQQDNISTGGGARAENESAQDDQTEASNSTNEAVRESLKQLGDAMKEFHRRQKSIKEHDESLEEDDQQISEKTEPKELDGTEELEHVGKDDQFDTQALGKSSNEHERQEIDESMAIDDDENLAEGEEKETAGQEDAGGEHGAGGAAETFKEEEESDSENQPVAVANAGMFAEDDDNVNDDKQQVKLEEEDLEVSRRDENDLWRQYESKTHDLALVLGEQLRLILEPTVASKLRGDYRTGKRLNMKRIIPYIASEFRKDKIWLRRTKPAKREYQIMLALDDSKSMGEPAVVDLAFQAIALVGKALSSIEAGQIGIMKFGSTTDLVHSLSDPFTPEAGNNVFRQFCFNQQRTNVHHLLERSLDIFAETSTSGEQWKLEIIVSDGITDDHATLRTLVRRAYDERVMLVFVILDALNRDTSILDMNEVKYTTDENGNPKLEVAKYMEEFPFDYYVIVKNIGDLPMVLASVLRQYFQALEL